MLSWTGYQRGPWEATTVEVTLQVPHNLNPNPNPDPGANPNPNPNPKTLTPTLTLTLQGKRREEQAFGKIQPRRSGPGHSATGIYPPSNWNPALLRRSRRPPGQQLQPYPIPLPHTPTPYPYP